MTKKQFLKIIYWLGASVLIAILLQNAIPFFWDAWLISLFFLPAALITKFGLKEIKHLKGIKKWSRYILIALSSLYWGYIAIIIAYWYFLELKANSINNILISPIFIWVLIGFFVLMELVIFNTSGKKQNETISIYSDRKKTTIIINNLAYIESRGDFTIATLIDGSEYKNNMRISEWEQKLNGFLRIHRSFLVNPVFTTLKGNEVVVNAKWELPISRGYKQNVQEYFNNPSEV